jgi:hypothetical protein
MFSPSQVFLEPLKRAARDPATAILSETEISGIFSNIELILGVNNTLYQSIEERLQQWSQNPCLGDIFERLVRSFSAVVYVCIYCVIRTFTLPETMMNVIVLRLISNRRRF